MAYEKLNLANGQKLNAAHLAHIENGIADAEFTDADKESIISEVLAILEESSVVKVTVDADKNISLSGDLEDGTYTIKYNNADGSTTTICTLTISGGNSSGGTTEPEEPDEPDVPVGSKNLFVASTCTLNTRLNSSGENRDQDNTFVTDYIDIGDCLANGGTNQIHFRNFVMYKLRTDGSDGAIDASVSIGGAYRAINYYDTNNVFLGQTTTYYTTDFVGDANGDGVITLDATKTTATKIRICGALVTADLTSTDQLSDCIVTLNELITD